MKWSEEKVQQLKGLATSGASNKDIAHQLGIGISEVYAKRSQLGITIDKVKADKASESRQEKPKTANSSKRSTVEITHDLRMQLRSLSVALSEATVLLVELWDAEDLL